MNITDHKYLNATCLTDGCQWLVAEQQVDVYRQRMATVEAKLSAIESYCRQYAHAGSNAGTHEALKRVLEIIEG